MSGGGEEASACRLPLSPVCQPRHLPLPPFDSGLCGLTPTKEAHMPGINSSLHFPFHQVRRLTVIRRRAAIAGEAV